MATELAACIFWH